MVIKTKFKHILMKSTHLILQYVLNKLLSTIYKHLNNLIHKFKMVFNFFFFSLDDGYNNH
jgi:hypothetical protein